MKNQSKYIKEEILKNFKNNKDFEDAVVAEINGCNFSAADIAFLDNNKDCQVYRIIVIKRA